MAYDSDRLLNTRLGQINATGRGTIAVADAATTGTATITAVTTARTMVRHMGQTVTNEAGQTTSQYLTRVELTNTTTITATVAQAGAGARTLTVGYEYTEFQA